MNSAEQFRRIEALFQAARRLEPAERSAYLEDTCDGDHDLKNNVLTLLAEDEIDGSPLDRPILGESVSLDRLAHDASRTEHEPPESIGQYRILRTLGRGGMGVVYEAEQEKPRRTVALKVIHAGFASPEVLRRFEHEADMLARLQHPGIANVFESGTFDSGHGEQPFLAMELIDGVPLTDYASNNNLPTPQRLELFAKVCDAVEHAHQRAIIHRDLKPTNILVDRSGQPKILDFGVARATDGDIQATTLRTNVGQLIGTVPYMSPEQAAGDPNEVDMRSDVYALGVLAYELLAGRLPYDVREKMVHEAVRAIREDDPTPLGSINKTFAGDIWTIIRKALEKDKTRRYQSAAELSADIGRYLGDEPIAARPPTATYQLRKFARRNRALVAGVATALVTLVLGTAVAIVLAVRATNAQQLAEERLIEADEAREDAEAVIRVLSNTLSSANPSLRGRNVLVTDILEDTAKRLSRDWADRPLVEARLRFVVGVTYMTLGRSDTANTHLERALELRRRELGAEHPDTLGSMLVLAKLRRRQGRNDLAEPLLVESLAVRRSVLGLEHRDTAASMSNLGHLYVTQDRLEEAEPLLLEGWAIYRKVLSDLHSHTLTAMNNVAILYHQQGRYEEAEPLYLRSLEQRRLDFGEEHTHTVYFASNLGVFYMDTGRYTEAEPLFEQSLTIRRKLLGNEHPTTLGSIAQLGHLYYLTERYDEAAPLLADALAGRRSALGPDHPRTLHSMDLLARLYVAEGRFEEALELSDEAIAGRLTDRSRALADELPVAPQLPQVEQRTLGEFLITKGSALSGLSRFDEAHHALLEAYELLPATPASGPTGGPRMHQTKRALRALAALFEKWGKPTEAAEHLATAAALEDERGE